MPRALTLTLTLTLTLALSLALALDPTLARTPIRPAGTLTRPGSTLVRSTAAGSPP